MISWKKTKIGEFLFEREGRFKPDDKALLNLDRLEKIDFSGNFYIGKKASRTDMILIKKGDFVISGINVSKGAMGIYREVKDIIATIHYSSYTFDESKIDINYFEHFLQSSGFIKLLEEQVKGGIKTEIKAKHLLNLEIYLPPLQEQKQIAEKLKLGEEKQKILAQQIANQKVNLKNLRKQILQDAIQGKLTKDWRQANPNTEPASELLKKIKKEKEKLIAEKKIKAGKKQVSEKLQDLIFNIPNNWAWECLDDISQYITDGTHQTPSYVKKGEIFLSAQNVKPFRFIPDNHKFVSRETYNDYIKNREAEKGDILFARVGAGIGEAAVIDIDIKFAFYVSLGLIKNFKQYISPEYIALVFNSPFGVKYSKGNISSKGGSAGNFNLGRVRSFMIPLPPLAEQLAIVSKLQTLMQKIDEAEQQVEKSLEYSKQLSNAILSETFNLQK